MALLQALVNTPTLYISGHTGSTLPKPIDHLTVTFDRRWSAPRQYVSPAPQDLRGKSEKIVPKFGRDTMTIWEMAPMDAR